MRCASPGAMIAKQSNKLSDARIAESETKKRNGIRNEMKYIRIVLATNGCVGDRYLIEWREESLGVCRRRDDTSVFCRCTTLLARCQVGERRTDACRYPALIQRTRLSQTK
jgi:hypothetical protein